MSIGEKSVYVKTYNAYFHDHMTMFVGARSTEVIDYIYGFDFLQHPFIAEEKNICKYIEYAYNFLEPVYDGIDPDAFDREYAKCKETKYHLRDDVTEEEKCFIFRIISKNIEKFKLYVDYENYPKFKDKSLYNRFFAGDLLSPDAKNLKNVEEGRYLDVFWRKSEDEVLLRAEYCFKDGNWKEISVKDLSDSRKIENSSGGPTINIPADKTCYLLLSDIKQSAKRLEEIRLKIQRRKPIYCPYINKDLSNTFFSSMKVNSITTKSEVVMTSNSFQDTRLRAIEIPPLNGSLTKNVIKTHIGYENVTFEGNNSIPTVIVPDYAEYAETLFAELDKNYSDYLRLTGADLREVNQATNKDIPVTEESVKRQNDCLLKYLSETVCNNNDKWDMLLNKDRYFNKSLKKDFYRIRIKYAYSNYCALKLSWWISQTPYQEMLYDYDYYYYYVERSHKKFEESIFDHFIKYLAILENLTVANDALIYLYNDARFKASGLFKKLNPYLGSFEEYLLGKNSQIKDDLEVFDTCRMIEDENFLVDIFFPTVKKYTDYYYDTLGYLSHIVIISESKNYKIENLFTIFRKFWSNINSKILNNKDIVIRSITNKRIKLTINNGFDSIAVYYFSEKKKDESIVSNITNSKLSKGLEHAITAFDRCIAIYQLSKTEDPNDYITVFNDIIGDLLELSGHNDEIKNTMLGKIKINGNPIFENYSGLVSLGAEVLSFMYYLYEGDTAYACADFTCDIVILILTVAFPEGGFILAIMLYLAKTVLKNQIENLKTDDYEKWVLCNCYGKYFDDLTKENAWKHTIYPRYVVDSYAQYLDLDGNSKKNMLEADTSAWKKDSIEQVKTYYKIGYKMSFDLTPFRLLKKDYDPLNDPNDNERYTSFNMLRIDISTRLFFKKDNMKLRFRITKNNKDFTVNLNNDDFNVYYDDKKVGYKLVIILATDIYKITDSTKDEIIGDFKDYRLKPESITIVNTNETKILLDCCDTGVCRGDHPIIYTLEYYSTYYDNGNPFIKKEDTYFNNIRYINYQEK